MTPWIKLGWKEFWLPFLYWKKNEGCPGGRDFLWLSIFMALILILMLLLYASREGLLNRFVDVFLGNVPGHGVPITVTTSIISRGGVNFIDSSVLAEIESLGKAGKNKEKAKIKDLKVHPYRTIEQGDLYIELPDNKIWKNRLENGKKIGPDFKGWAVYADDPMWSQNPDSEPLSTHIIMSRALFKEQYFDYKAYHNALKNELPDEIFKTIPEKVDKDQEKPLDELWLRLNLLTPDCKDISSPCKIVSRKELFPCKITWVDRFPVIDKIAFLFPLSTYHALKTANDNPFLRYFPEAKGQGKERIKEIGIERYPGEEETQFLKKTGLCRKLASKLGAREIIEGRGGDIRIKFKYPVRKSWFDAYARQYNIKYLVSETVSGDKIGYKDGKLILPCERLQSEYLGNISCSEESHPPVYLDATAKGYGFFQVLVYIPDRTLLSAAKDELKKVRDNALSIHPSYEDALNRFAFLSKILEALKDPYLLFLAIFIICFLGIQIGTLIGHRRHNYGIFLAKGMEYLQIYLMLWLQLFMATVLGTVFAWLGISVARIHLEGVIRPVSYEYKDTLNFRDFNLLPILWTDYIWASSIVFIIACILAFTILYMPLRERTNPAVLLQ